jgi:DNA-binding transcriptional LysR family regulator
LERDVDFKELEAFVQVYELRSFSQAAEQLYLAQSTVSGYISALERNLNCRLLARTTKEICPTDMGRLFYDYAKELLQVRSAAMQALSIYRKEMKGTISIAASSIPGQYYLPRLLHDFREQYPDISFNMLLVDSAEVVDLVAARKVDLGFSGTMFDNAKCIYAEFANDKFVIITPPYERYREYRKTGFPIQQITKESFIRREAGSGSRRETEQFLQEMGISARDLRVAVEARSPDAIKQLVSEGVGIAVISEEASRDYCQFGKIYAFNFDIADFKRKLFIIRHKNGVLSPIAQTFRDFARSYYLPRPEAVESP